MDHNRRKPIQVAGEKVIISEIVCSEATYQESEDATFQ
jgi:hypothetical protein